MISNDDFAHILQSVQWPVYGFIETPFHLIRTGWGRTEREGRVVGVDLIYKRENQVSISITTLDASDKINILGARRSLEEHVDPRLNQDYRLFQKYRLDKMKASPGDPQIIQQAFSILENTFEGQIRIWPALLLARFIFFGSSVTIQGDVYGLKQQEIQELPGTIIPINEVL